MPPFKVLETWNRRRDWDALFSRWEKGKKQWFLINTKEPRKTGRGAEELGVPTAGAGQRQCRELLHQTWCPAGALDSAAGQAEENTTWHLMVRGLCFGNTT